MKNRAYRLTIIDVVAILIICTLAIILFVPLSTNARNHSKQTICLVNVQGLMQAWNLYHADNDGYLVGGSTYHSTEYRWCESPLVENAPIPIPDGVNPAIYRAPDALMDFAARKRGIQAGKLFPYTQNEKLYHCPADMNHVEHDEPYAVYRTYAISGLMNGEEGYYNRTVTNPQEGTHIKLITAKKFDQIHQPATKYVFVEEDVVDSPVHSAQKYNLGGFIIMAGGNYWSWWDIPGSFHNNSSTLGFADGHAEVHQWQDARTLALMTHERGQPGQPPNIQPDNEDLEYMITGYLPCE